MSTFRLKFNDINSVAELKNLGTRGRRVTSFCSTPITPGHQPTDRRLSGPQVDLREKRKITIRVRNRAPVTWSTVNDFTVWLRQSKHGERIIVAYFKNLTFISTKRRSLTHVQESSRPFKSVPSAAVDTGQSWCHYECDARNMFSCVAGVKSNSARRPVLPSEPS